MSTNLAGQGEFQVDIDDDFLGHSSVAALANGGFIVTWEKHPCGGAATTYGRHYDANGVPDGSSFPIDPSPPTGPADGYSVVVRSDQGDVYAQRYDSNGAPVGAEFRVNTYTTGSQDQPSVTMLADGGFVVV